MTAVRHARDPNAIVLIISGPIARADIGALCARLEALFEHGAWDVIVCDVGGLVDPDAVAIDTLARLQLTARSLGARIRLLHVCNELQELLALAGLCDILPLAAELRLEARRQTEEREHALGVEEEHEPADPPV